MLNTNYNDAHVKGARFGMYKGEKYTFTHRDPSTGKIWGEDVPNGKELGKWVAADSITWL